MAYDVDAFRAAHRPWSFTVGGRTYQARHVSAPQVFRYQDLIAAAGEDRRRHDAALRWLLRRAFPWRFSYLLYGDPVRIISALETAARQEALSDFFVALRGGPIPNQNGRATRGTISPTPISTRRR